MFRLRRRIRIRGLRGWRWLLFEWICLGFSGLLVEVRFGLFVLLGMGFLFFKKERKDVREACTIILAFWAERQA